MFTEGIMNKYADVMMWAIKNARKTVGGKFKEGEYVRIGYDPTAVNLAELMAVRILREGLNPVVRAYGTDNMAHNFLTYASDKQLTDIAPWEEVIVRNLSGHIALLAPQDLFNLEDIDPAKMSKMAVVRKFLREIFDDKEAKGEFAWTLTFLPTAEQASQSKLSLRDYEDQVIKACGLDWQYPTTKWENLKAEANCIMNTLWDLGVDRFHIEGENTDLIVGMREGRKFMGFTGHNMPSYEIFTSPDWHRVDGIFHADIASFRDGRYVKGVDLTFKDGEITSAKAEEGDEYLQAQLNTDEGAKRMGEFSATDRRHSRIDKLLSNGLMDENYGGEFGNCHIALGKSFADCHMNAKEVETKEQRDKLGFNDSAIHWDFIQHTDRKITAYLKDGSKKVIYEGGQFIY